MVRDRKESTASMILQHHQDKQLLHSIFLKYGWFDCAAWLLRSCFEKSGSTILPWTIQRLFESQPALNAPIPLQQDPSTETISVAVVQASTFSRSISLFGMYALSRHFQPTTPCGCERTQLGYVD